ncbi:MAG TPA: aldose 1-epimerase [Ktedonobacteraceae bacterium]|nr:aldose 1-epimerase [Ktedonobacteraceae bacterium]
MIEDYKNSVTHTSSSDTPAFRAEVGFDAGIGSTVISLGYTNATNPAHNLLACIASDLGSNLFRLQTGEHELIYCEQDLLKQRNFTGDFVLWPLPNRIRDKRYIYQGHEYSLADIKRPQGNAVLIHGLVLDQVWQYEQPVVTSDAASVTTFIDITQESPHYAAYPFESRLSLTYTLTSDGLSTTYHVHNKGQHTLPFGFALHPYFSLLSGPDDTYISLPADAVMEADSDLLPTGRMLDVTTLMYAMFDLRQPVRKGNLNLDHVYTNMHPHAPVVIDYRKQHMQLQISTSEDFTHAVIYAPPSDPFFCLEHQTCSTDAINLNNQGAEQRKIAHLQEVTPNATSSGTINYRIRYI